MANKRKSKKKADPDQITTPCKSGEDTAIDLERAVLRPTVQAAVTLKDCYKPSYGDLALKGLIGALVEQTNASIDGDTRRSEAMLTTQAHTLDAIFNTLARRAINTEYMKNLDTYLKLALRAQSQCRSTWEALSAIKNPPVMGYVKQANIAHGPQQVNNASTAPDSDSRVQENQNPQNKLMEIKDGERLDTRAKSTTGETDPTMATLGEVDGTQDGGRKKKISQNAFKGGIWERLRELAKALREQDRLIP